MTITEFLTARLDEDELMAVAAIDDDSGQDGGFEDAYEDLIRPPSGVGTAQGGFGQAAARMIVWNTPRRVLADVAAKRAIVKEYVEAEAYYRAHADAPAGELTGLKSAVRHLASAYASHKDYGRAQ